MSLPLVSVIVPTYNSSHCLAACLRSICNQSYKNIELIVVDNNSKDNTKEIAKSFTKKVFNRGPERSAQRNYGVSISSGKYVAIIDSDMELSTDVIQACVAEIESKSEMAGVVIPEESFGEGWWASCKKLERSFYVGVPWMEAARFFSKADFEKVGGYNEAMVSGEDWDLSQRVGGTGRISRIYEFILHNEGRISLTKTINKKYYYAQKFASYVAANRGQQAIAKQTGLIGRYWLFLSKPSKLFKNPLLGISMLFMKTCEFGVGGVGYLIGKSRGHGKHT